MKVYLAQPWGGLGDNLQFSTLPKLYHEKGYEFYLSNENSCRNDEIFEFCWGTNPYVRGVVNHPPTVGSIAPDLPLKTVDNIISASEIRHGFSPTNRYADIYYEPKLIDDLSETILVDLSAVTLFRSGIDRYYNMDKLFESVSKNIPKENSRIVQFTNSNFSYLSGEFEFERNPINVGSIFEYADYIHSCKEYYCLYSGGNTMASAIKYKYNSKVEINCFLHWELQRYLDMGYFIYDNVNYIEAL
jgi:hypothetical protein